jgi:hypothetical protein
MAGAMSAGIFISYRRDDDPSGAARVRDGLAAVFGNASLFMDVDSLFAGQRFDRELAKALARCKVLIAVIGQRWMELLDAKSKSGDREYVREEISEALKREIVVIPVRVGREGQLPSLPNSDELPSDIRELVLFQKLDIAHEHFSRDIQELVTAIRAVARVGVRKPTANPFAGGWIFLLLVSPILVLFVAVWLSSLLH